MTLPYPQLAMMKTLLKNDVRTKINDIAKQTHLEALAADFLLLAR